MIEEKGVSSREGGQWSESRREPAEKLEEKGASPERFMQEAVLKMDLDLDAMNNDGDGRLAEIDRFAGLDRQEVETVKKQLDISEKLSDIRSRALKFKNAMRNAMLIGMSALAFSGDGDFGSPVNAGYGEGDLSSDNISGQGVSAGTEEKISKEKLIENFQEAMKDVREISEKKWKSEPELDPRPRVEEIRREVEKYISSPQYLDRLILEVDGDIEKARKVQEERIGNVNAAKTDFMPFMPAEGAFYVAETNNVILSDVKSDIADKVAEHEFLHASTRGDFGITGKAKMILNDSYVPTGKKVIGYDLWSTERLVRKQILDIEMEKLGIKKYDEKFTREHYKKLLRSYHKGELSRSAREFMEKTGPEYFEKIFDGIAKNDMKESNSDYA
ncbi:MAG: hypothetical protein WC120_03755 [Parcubacteria group bacterium]